MDGACLYCKLTYESKGSGELINTFIIHEGLDGVF